MIKKIEVFYKEDECFIKDNFDENLKVTKAEKIMIDKINELIDKIFIYKNNETEIRYIDNQEYERIVTKKPNIPKDKVVYEMPEE